MNWAFSNGSADVDAYNRLESVDFTNLDAADLTQMYGILAYDRTLTSVNLNMLNADQITDMAEAFRSTSITGLDLTAIGDGRLWTISNMCNSCTQLETVRTGWTLPVLYYAQARSRGCQPDRHRRGRLAVRQGWQPLSYVQRLFRS